MADYLQFLMSRPAGCAIPAIVNGQTAFLCREDREGLRSYPMPCPVEIRLQTWEVDGVIVTAFLARLDDRDSATFETWLNAKDTADGRAMIESLTLQPHIDVHLFVNSRKPARSMRSHNLLKNGASHILELADPKPAWTMAQFDAARAKIEAGYPSIAALWASGLAG